MKQDHEPKNNTGAKLVIPFFITMAILTVVSFLLPLRPTRSQMERRNLAQFPEFSWTALTEGSYFDDITLWFSDTFPGRESWLMLSSQLSSLHGYSEIAISGNLGFLQESPQTVTLQAPEETQKPQETVPAASTEPESRPTETVQPEPEMTTQAPTQPQEPQQTVPAPTEPLPPPTETVLPDKQPEQKIATQAATQPQETRQTVPTTTEPLPPPTETVLPETQPEPKMTTQAPTQPQETRQTVPTTTEPLPPPTETVLPETQPEPEMTTEAPTQPQETQETVPAPTTEPEPLPTETVLPETQPEPEMTTQAPTQAQEPEETVPAPTTEPLPPPTETEALPETEPTETQWGGIDAGDGVNVEINGSAVIQIGSSAFSAVGFSEVSSKNYAAALNALAEALEGENVRIVSAPAPTAVGILIEPQYLQRMQCANQDETIRFLHDQMDDSIVKVDTYAALIPHNDEYIYFRTDHHWTARGAFYAYEAICEALGYEAVPLEEYEEWDQGEFEGSLYWKAPYPRKLKKDTLIAYVPKADLELRLRGLNWVGSVQPVIQDMTEREINTKYSAFLFADNPMVQVTNNDLPDGPTALVIKDSFGNVLVPFLAQNYSKIYAIDYRLFHETNIRFVLRSLPVDDVIFVPYLLATQSQDGANAMKWLCS